MRSIPADKHQDKEVKEGGSKDAVLSSIVCRNCGKLGHWTLKCPLKGSLAPAGFDSPDARSETLPSGTPGKYQAPGRRPGAPGGAPGAPSGDSMYDRRRGTCFVCKLCRVSARASSMLMHPR